MSLEWPDLVQEMSSESKRKISEKFAKRKPLPFAKQYPRWIDVFTRRSALASRNLSIPKYSDQPPEKRLSVKGMPVIFVHSDLHVSHTAQSLIDLFLSFNIFQMLGPSHTSSVIAPLDTSNGTNYLLKKEGRKCLQFAYTWTVHSGKKKTKICKMDLPYILSAVLRLATAPEKIIQSFVAAGHFNPDVVLKSSKLDPSGNGKSFEEFKAVFKQKRLRAAADVVVKEDYAITDKMWMRTASDSSSNRDRRPFLGTTEKHGVKPIVEGSKLLVMSPIKPGNQYFFVSASSS